MAEINRDVLLKRMRLLENMRQLEQEQSSSNAGLQGGAEQFPQAYAPGDPNRLFATDPTEEAIEAPLVDPVGLIAGGGAGGLVGGAAGALSGGLVGGFSAEPGASGANLGEAVGMRAGLAAGPFAPVAVPAGAVIGGTTGFLLEELLTTGKAPSKKRLAGEAALTAVPGVIQSTVKTARTPLRRLVQRRVAENRAPGLSGTQAGQVLRKAEQFRLLQGQGRDIFQAPSKSAVDEAFDAVRKSGTQVSPDPIQSFIARSSPKQRKALISEIERADAKLNERIGTPGKKRFQELVGTIEDIQAEQKRVNLAQKTGRTSAPLAVRMAKPLDIGDAQDLRSALRERIEKTQDPVKVDLLTDLKETVDASIDATIQGVDTRQARDMFRRFKAAEELEGFFVKNSNLPTGKGNIRILRLSSLRNALDQASAGQGDRATQRFYQTIQNVPGAEDRLHRALAELEPLVKQLEVNIGGGDVAGLARDSRIAAMFRGVGEALLSDRGIELFLDAAKERKGRIDGNTMALILNATRRELAGLPTEEETSTGSLSP